MCKKPIFVSLLLVLALVASAQADVIINAVQSCRVDGDPARRDENRHDSSKLSMRTSSNGWKSWVKFEIGDLDVDRLETATLTVALNRGKDGNNHFDISYVNDDCVANIDWDERSITWNNAPGNDTAVLDLLDPTKTTYLTTVYFTDGVAGDAFTVDILDVLRADTDGIVQFVFHNSNNLQDLATHDHAEEAWRPFIDATEGTNDQAREPYPADGAKDIPRDAVLSWTPGEFTAPANGHKVYFGENFNDVNDGSGAIAQSAASYTPAKRLDFETTYYWRVDQIAGAPDFTVFKGDVWSFKTEPVAYPIANITATASSSFPGQGPENTVNGSGLSDDLHSTALQATWLSDLAGPQPTWIQFDFDKVYLLHDMWVWNSNTEFEKGIGYGIKDVSIEYSADGVNYATLETTHEFNRAPGEPEYEHNTTVDFADLTARHVRFTAGSNWGGLLSQYGLSEVRFYHTPVRARKPYPDSGARGVDVDVTLGWRAGRRAGTHNVYLSADEQTVVDGTAPVTTVDNAAFSASDLDLDTTYYWRIDEVNDVETPTTWQGDVWSFTTRQFVVVDDFESYNDIAAGEEGSNLVYLTWVDGYDDPATNGSTMGYSIPYEPTMETDEVHNGRRSAPMTYNNTTAAFSEVTRTLASQNWAANGVQTLSLWFFGDPANTPGQLYAKINSVKANYDGPAGNLAISDWQLWNIDLASVGTNLQSVTSLGIGVDGFGAGGTLLLDDIRLYSTPPTE